MNTTLDKTTRDKIKRACSRRWVSGGYKTRVNYNHQTVELLVNSKDFMDGRLNNVIQLSYKNGLFDPEILHQLLANGHDINNINMDGHGILASVFLENGDPLAKINWLLQNGCKYMFCKKQGNNWVNDKFRNTEAVLDILMQLYLLKTVDRSMLDKLNNTKRYIELLDIIDGYEPVDEHILGLIKTMADNGIILTDLTNDNSLVSTSYFLLFLMRDKITELEKIIKLNYDIDNFSGTSILMSKKSSIIPYDWGVPKIRPFHITDEEISVLHNLVLQRCQNHKKLYTALIGLFSTLGGQLSSRIVMKQSDYDYYHKDDYNMTQSMKESFDKYYNVEMDYMRKISSDIHKLTDTFKKFLN